MHSVHAQTRARVDIALENNATWQDAFQFGDTDDTTWDLTGQHFRLDIKSNKDDTTALFTCTDANGRIVVDDTVQRVIHMNVDDASIQAVFTPGEYVYDLVMFDESTPPVRVLLMGGKIAIGQGVTGDP